MKGLSWRAAAWAVVLLAAAFRPGVDRLDRWLARRCWDIPSEWNAIADVAIETGVVDPAIGGARAPWRQASVVPASGTRLAVVTVSDMQRSRAVFLTERYDVLGVFERSTTTPALVTDETRGYKPLTHYWPLVLRDGRVETFVAFAPTLSDPVSMGQFAYLAVGREDTQVLFVCRLRWGPSSMHGVLERTDVNGDGVADLVFYARGRRNEPPLATFVWDAAKQGYIGRVTDEGRPLISWWSTAPDDRRVVPRGRPIDEVVNQIAARISSVRAQ
jgi:hypothetical protein